MDEHISQTVGRLRKSGKLQEAWDIACPAIEKSPDDKYLQSAFYWLCYDHLKEILSLIRAKQDEAENELNLGQQDLEKINYYVDWIDWLNFPPDDFIYRPLLLIFQKYLRLTPRLVLLLYKYFDHLFKEEDKQPFKNEKGESPSLMLRFTRTLARSWMQNEVLRCIEIDDLLTLFDRTRSEVGDQTNLVWLNHDKAKCLIFADRLTEAREFAVLVLKKKQTESWAWHVLGTTFKKDDLNASRILLSKALCLSNKDSYELPILKDLSLVLAEQGILDEASMCISRAVEIIKNNNWKVKSDLRDILEKDWYDSKVDSSSLKPILERQSVKALDYLIGETTTKVAVVESLHRSAKGFQVFLNRDLSIAVRLGIFERDKLPELGEYIRLTIAKSDNLVVSAEAIPPVEMKDVEVQKGTLKIINNSFGFINNTFVPPHLIQTGYEEQIVRVLAVYTFHKKKEQYGWKAVKILDVSENSIP